MKLGSPSALLPNALVDIKMSDTEDVDNLAKSGNGTGPYKVGSFVPNQSLTLVPNPNHFGGKACLQSIEFVREPDPTAMVTDFKAAGLDMIWQVRPTDVPALQGGSISFLKPAGVSGAHVWELDTKSAPFDDPRARQALSYATNRVAMNKAAFSGLATPSLGNSLISANSAAYNKKLKPYTFNLEKAKSSSRRPASSPARRSRSGRLPGGATSGSRWPRSCSRTSRRSATTSRSSGRTSARGWRSSSPPGKSYPNTIIANYFSMPPNPTFAMKQGQFGSCECNWKNNTFEALAAKAPGIKDAAARQVVYDKMQQIFSAYAPALVIAHQTNIVAVQKRITNAWEDAQGNVHLEEAKAQ